MLALKRDYIGDFIIVDMFPGRASERPRRT